MRLSTCVRRPASAQQRQSMRSADASIHATSSCFPFRRGGQLHRRVAEGIKAKLFKILGDSEPLTSSEIWAKAEVCKHQHLTLGVWPVIRTEPSCNCVAALACKPCIPWGTCHHSVTLPASACLAVLLHVFSLLA